MKSRYLLLPPSEGKAIGGRGKWDPYSGRFGATLGGARIEIAERLQKFVRNATVTELEKFFGVRGDHLDRAVGSAEGGFVGARALPARERYSGVVFGHFEMTTLPADARRWCTTRVVIVSGLLGLVAAGDPVPDYRLKMGARLPEIGGIAQWWKPRITAAAEAQFGNSLVVDLLPNEHRAAIDGHLGAHKVVRVEFVAANGASAAGHAAKAAKGLVARRLVMRRDETLAASVHGFEGAGFMFRSIATSKTRDVVEIAVAS